MKFSILWYQNYSTKTLLREKIVRQSCVKHLESPCIRVIQCKIPLISQKCTVRVLVVSQFEETAIRINNSSKILIDYQDGDSCPSDTFDLLVMTFTSTCSKANRADHFYSTGHALSSFTCIQLASRNFKLAFAENSICMSANVGIYPRLACQELFNFRDPFCFISNCCDKGPEVINAHSPIEYSIDYSQHERMRICTVPIGRGIVNVDLVTKRSSLHVPRQSLKFPDVYMFIID